MSFVMAPFAMAEGEPGSGAASSFEPDLLVTELRFSGLERTNSEWIESYLGLRMPERLTRPDIIRLQRKLMTTGVFSDVKVAVEPTSEKLDAFTLWFQVEEKWTMIPVVRGVYGGGTPLAVLGIYDIHSFGRLLTLGGEMRKYGDAPPGFILYGRDPRNQGGRNYFGAEYWREYRKRQILDSSGEKTGDFSTDTSLVRLKVHTPFNREQTATAHFAWRFGFDLELQSDRNGLFDPAEDYEGDPSPSGSISKLKNSKKQSRTLATIVYDDVEVNQLDMDGLRAKLRAGPNISDGKNYSLSEFEAFYYSMVPMDINVASHLFLGQSTLNAPSTQYFLGGFDSVRGLPDGVTYGTRFAFFNFELRKVTSKEKYFWLQPALFIDAGNAGNDWSALAEEMRSSAGAGIRISIPQVYRLIFRIDYAVSLDGSGQRGITAGMNQFFDPYRPL